MSHWYAAVAHLAYRFPVFGLANHFQSEEEKTLMHFLVDACSSKIVNQRGAGDSA
jgi:hypothetical protein